MVWVRLCPVSARLLDERVFSSVQGRSIDPVRQALQTEVLAFLGDRFQTACDIFHIVSLADRQACLEGLATVREQQVSKKPPSHTAPSKQESLLTASSKKGGQTPDVSKNGKKGEQKSKKNTTTSLSSTKKDTDQRDDVVKDAADADSNIVPLLLADSPPESPATFAGLLVALDRVVQRRRAQLAIIDPAYRRECVPLSPFPHDERLLIPVSLAQRILSLPRASHNTYSPSSSEVVLSSKQDQITRVTQLISFVAAAGEDPACSPSATTTCGGARSVCGFVVNPSESPPNAQRREKNLRLLRVEQYEQERQYNAMVRGVTPGAVLTHSRKMLSSSGGAALSLFSNDPSLEPLQQKESYASFMKDVRFGLDMRLMSVAGGIVGYYLCHVRGFGRDVSIVGAAVGAILMMFVDALLLMIRIGKEDTMEAREKLQKRKKLQQ